MPKNLTPTMRAHLDAETTRLAAIWRITRKVGQQFFFTDHDRDIGRTLEIKGWTQASRTLELWEPARRAVQVGDQFRLYAGCSKRVVEDCRDKFRIPGSLLFAHGNARNFRGEPYVPGGALVAQAR